MTRRSFLAAAGGIRAPAAAGPELAHAFRLWFCWLAESAWFMNPLPVEIRDCSSLIRFAYRESLRPHTSDWARQWGYPWLPPYPDPPPGPARLFRAGQEQRHFADARHLMRFNTGRVSRRLEDARPADLLFFRSPDGASWHVMAFLGPSRFETSADDFVVYHTGPEGTWPGEVRRPTVRQLLSHPEPRWRPVEGNACFLGVYRWNLLLGKE